ncbi:MAG: hypothetical protein GKR77_06220 [Legionellales bacterium]|nr:hypothetical protein [Legionellales bacterium]
MEGIREGVNAGSRIKAEANQHIIKHLQRVQTHLLKPLHRRVNASMLTRGLISMGHWIEFAGKKIGYTLLNLCKRVGNLFRRDSFKLSMKNPYSQSYRESSLTYSTALRKLTALTVEDVKAAECPPDTVARLDSMIEKPSMNPMGLFVVREIDKSMYEADPASKQDVRCEQIASMG